MSLTVTNKIIKLNQFRENLNIRVNNKIGLVTGCFDLLHPGHVFLFKNAKEYCDILIVGLDSDLSITKTKGSKRPLYNFNHRSYVLSELISIDYIFEIEFYESFDNSNIEETHKNILNIIKPTFLFTNSKVDKYIKEKTKRIEGLNTKIIDLINPFDFSSTSLIKRFSNE